MSHEQSSMGDMRQQDSPAQDAGEHVALMKDRIPSGPQRHHVNRKRDTQQRREQDQQGNLASSKSFRPPASPPEERRHRRNRGEGNHDLGKETKVRSDVSFEIGAKDSKGWNGNPAKLAHLDMGKQDRNPR